MQRDAPGFVLLDVRSPGAYDTGHLPGASNLPHGRIVGRTLDEGFALVRPVGEHRRRPW